MRRIAWTGAVVVGVVLSLGGPVLAAKIVLKSGKIIEGEIIERAPDHVRVREADGIALNYYRTEIARLEEGDPAQGSSTPIDTRATVEEAVKTPAQTPSGATSEAARKQPVDVPRAPARASARRWTTAIATYRLDGDEQGQETVYIDGERLAVESHVTMEDGRPTDKHSLKIDDGQAMCGVALISTGAQAVCTKTGGWPALTDYLEDWYPKREVSQTSDAQWQDKPARQYALDSQRAGVEWHQHALFHQGLLVRDELKTNFMRDSRQTREALDAQFDVPVPPEKFVVPSDAQFHDWLSDAMPNLEKQSQQSIQERLIALRDDPDYGGLIAQALRPDGQVDVLLFRRVLRQEAKQPPLSTQE